jgi:hypothetical protein
LKNYQESRILDDMGEVQPRISNFRLSHNRVTIDRFSLVTGFIEHLQIVTTSNYSAITSSHTLQFTTACSKSSQPAVSSPVVC